MTAIETLLTGLIDYAGLYPPAALDMRTAVDNYLRYQQGEHAYALGRFIVDAARLEEFIDCANGSISKMPLSVIVGPDGSLDAIQGELNRGMHIQSIEVKSSEPSVIWRICERLPDQVERYFEIPIQPLSFKAIDAIASFGGRAKLRMGGVVSEAFPAASDVIVPLRAIADRRIPFKATAGLHHPVRSVHRLMYKTDSPSATMHGFLNLFCAAALVFRGGAAHAEAVLEEDDPAAFRIEPGCLAWRSQEWTAQQISTIRQKVFTSFGSCSFAEPLQDLEALGWL